MPTNLQITIPALRRPNLNYLQKRWPWIKSIEKDTSPTKKITLNLTTVLKDGESYITGTEKESIFA